MSNCKVSAKEYSNTLKDIKSKLQDLLEYSYQCDIVYEPGDLMTEIRGMINYIADKEKDLLWMCHFIKESESRGMLDEQ